MKSSMALPSNGKTVRDWRLGRRQGSRRQLRVRPGHRQMDEEAADAAAGPPCGAGRGERQDLRVWRLRRPGGHRDPARRRMGTHRRRVGVRSGDRFMEVAAAAARQARFGDRRRSRRQDLRDRRRHDGGRVQGRRSSRSSGPPRCSAPTTSTTPPRTSGRAATPMSVPRNHAFGGVVNGKIYVIGGRTGHGFILSATNTDVVEEYNPVSNTWSCRRSGCRPLEAAAPRARTAAGSMWPAAR